MVVLTTSRPATRLQLSPSLNLEYKMKKKAYIVGGDYLISHMLADRGWDETDKIEDADLVIFTGGADISPEIYGGQNLGLSYTNPRRDDREVAAFEMAVEAEKAMAGICRGGQLLNSLMGGAMIQDVARHGGTHKMVVLSTNEEVLTTSTHHQMMVPGPDGEVLAVAYLKGEKNLSGLPPKYVNLVPDYDTEVVAYTHENGKPVFCFQGHPEYGHAPTTNVFFELLEPLLNQKVVN